MSTPRVVVTGVGGLSCLGKNAAENWDSMRRGICGVRPLDVPGMPDTKTAVAGQITEIPEHNFEKRALVSMSRFGLLAAITAGEALAQAGLDKVDDRPPMRLGTVIGVGIYGNDAVEKGYDDLHFSAKKRPEIFSVPKAMPSSAAVHVSMIHKLTGPVFGVTSACASGNHAIASALDLLRLGRADAIVAGGSDTPLTYGVIRAWEVMRILAKSACRPFSADRDGLILGEGSGAVVLETLESAQRRGATILAELVGAGMSGDASDIVAPTVEGPASAMRSCLADAGLDPSEVDYINAHGTATMGNDKTETRAIRDVFGAHADKLSVSSTKSMHAHCLGASSAIEALACIHAIRDGIVPPTMNYNEPDPECDLDVTPNVARARPISVAMSNAFAFGGSNAVVAFKAY